MPLRLAKLAEPIPGYKLLQRLGAGGFGEVWKAEAPGGLLKAIKIVRGNLQNTGPDNSVAQELQALTRVKAVRHPFLLSLERVDVVEGQLVIVMELADRDLRNRYKECQAQKLPGIPHDELLRYMEEVAEALDLMNIQYQLQHLDIKPQNLFLVHNHIKVADFGLCAALGATKTQAEGFTPLYAAPELSKEGISRACDQYSLAIVYQQMLTGKLPFTGSDPRELIPQHLHKAPDLSALASADRAVIGRALSKKPEDRFPTCADLVRALRGEKVGNAPVAVPAAAPPPATVAVTCVHCQRTGQVPREFQGRSVKCPGCGKSFPVPFSTVPTAPAAPEIKAEPLPEVRLPDDIGLAPLDDEVEAVDEPVEVAAEPVETVCPSCGHRGKVPAKFVGRKLKCRKCTKSFTIADASAKPTSAPKAGAPARPAPKAPVPSSPVAKPGKPAPPAAAKRPPSSPPPKPAPPPPAVEEVNPFADLTADPKTPPHRRK